MHEITDETGASRECPDWCRRAHLAGAHPDDQHHASRSRRVALVTGAPTLDPDDLAEATVVRAPSGARTRSEVTWLEVVSEEGQGLRMVATLDTARRLLAVLQDLLRLAAA